MYRCLLITCILWALCAPALAQELQGQDGNFDGVEFAPFLLKTDVGMTAAERRRFASNYARIVSRNLNHFLNAFNMDASDFERYAQLRGAEQGQFDPQIRLRIWRRFEPMVADLQKRYDTQAVAGGYMGQIQPRDEYGEPMGPAFREIATYAAGQSQEAVLRIIYHELGHLFMQTFMLLPAEVPNWLEEGTAQLFQYRPGNGTNPEEDRLRQLAWAYEMITHDHDFGRVIPWRELITVRNMDNLDFTYQSPLRSTQQYIQVWLITEYFVSDRNRSRAYMQMLNAMKEAVEQRWMNLVQQGRTGAALFNGVRYYLYDRQNEIFRNAYGRDILAVEDLWQEWVQTEYNRLLRRNPNLRYYRGTWHLDRRAGLAPSAEVRAEAIARARSIFEEAIEELPSNPVGYVGLARIAMGEKDEERARELFAEANRLGSQHFETLVFGGEALIRNNEAAAAIPGLEKALEERPSHWEATFYLGKALIITGQDVERGISLVRSAFHQRMSDPQVRNYEAFGHYLLGNYRQAAALFADIFVATGQRDAFSAAAAAITRARQMDDEDVENWLGRLQQINPDLAQDLHRRLIQEQEAIPLGFTPAGEPAIVGYTVSEDEAVIPVPQNPDQGQQRRRR
ncbi:MAG: hypothetical protein EA401_14535 [Planctomycetota bacterium]|nr:MAG: hypothetical protein EA401_14535 [Planctomycetota bacterium]